MQASLISVCLLVLYVCWQQRNGDVFRLWFRLWGCTLVDTFSPLFLPCVTSPVSPLPSIIGGWMDRWCFFLSLSPHDPWSVACPIQAILYPYSPSLHSSPVMCPPVLADYLPWYLQFLLSWFLDLLILCFSSSLSSLQSPCHRLF